MPAYKPLSVSGYHIREAGSTAAQELAFTLADGFGYVELGLARGLDVEEFAPGLSFFFDAHIDFFEEIAKFRAARRIWARWMRDVYGARSDKAQWLRFHTQTAGVSLTAQQPDNNVVRTAVEALAAVLGGTNSLHTNALDEVLALPSAKAAEIALRTQQVHPRGDGGRATSSTRSGGSWYVEALTDRIEAEAEEIFARIRDARHRRLHDVRDPARDRERLVHRRDRRRGVRLPARPREGRQAGRRASTPTSTRSRSRSRSSASRTRSSAPRSPPSRQRRHQRSIATVHAALGALDMAARGDDNLVEPMLAAARAEATLGEICGVLREVFGGYTEPARI